MQEQVAQGLTVSTMLDIGLKLAPQGTKLKSVLKTGKGLYATADKVSSGAESPGSAATSALLLWATPEEVERARSKVEALQKPEH